MLLPSARAKRFPWRATIAAVVVAAIAVGCSQTDGDAGNKGDSSDPGSFGPPPYQLPDGTDSSDGSASIRLGNVLCKAEAFKCYPDGTKTDYCKETSGSSDAGSDGGLQANDVRGCHVSTDGTTCLAAGAGKTNALCTTATDCAANFECVTSGAQGRCRHYCCDGITSCGNGEFCDIQATKDTKNLNVPVCMPVRECDLLALNIGRCNPDEDCTIVDENDGTTGCVTVGPAGVGEDCAEKHCGRGLACLGQSGQRKCYKLCKKDDANACDENEKCVGTAPLFQNSNIGTCSGR